MPPHIAPWAFVLAVPDIAKSAQYFRDVLGFQIQWEEATDWRLVERGRVRVMLGQCPTDLPAAELGSHNWFGYLETDDVAALYARSRPAARATPLPQIGHTGCGRSW